MNNYRVDVSTSNTVVPCGMNSIHYIGDSVKAAQKAFEATKPGFSAWGKPDNRYGVILSKWDGNKRNFVAFKSKGFK